jgi:hypothetical protein
MLRYGSRRLLGVWLNALLSLRVAKGAEVYKIQGSDYPYFSIIRASPPLALSRLIESTL